MELLSPAGNYLSAISAFNAGSDAIYIGGKAFSARMSAENFSDEEMVKIIEYAHLLDKKVYVTMNTLLYQDEFFQAVEYCKFLHYNGVDALIIQDLGLAYYLHKVYPLLELHASTQINCHNVEQAKALKQIGFKRIVLAREAPISLADEIKKLGLEVEVFIHGALCVSYSGNCLMSSFIGSRSGNRGRCAQPCRLEYSLCTDSEELTNNYAISTKDLNTLNYLDELISHEIDSLKIEGRLKQNEYVYLVTSIYRRVLDKKEKYDLKSDQKALQSIFSRQFTKGYLFSESPFQVLNQESSSHIGERIGIVKSIRNDNIQILLEKDVHRLDGIRFLDQHKYGRQIQKMFVNGEDVETAKKGQTIVIKHVQSKIDNNCVVVRTSSYQLLSKIELDSKNTIKKAINARIIAFKNKPLMFEIFIDKKHSVKRVGVIVEQAKSSNFKERIIEQFKKTNTLPLKIESIDFLGDEDIYVPINEINKLRNLTLNDYVNFINRKKEILENVYSVDRKVETHEEANIKAICQNPLQGRICQLNKIKTYSQENENLECRIVDKFSFNKIDRLVHFACLGQSLIASAYCNITNSYALDAYYSLGFDECLLSSELDYSSMKLLIDDYFSRHNIYPNVGINIYGRYDVMIMKSCPIGTYFHNKSIHCQRCHQKQYYLKDRLQEKFPLVGEDNCTVRVLDYKILYLIDKILELNKINIKNFYLNFTLENEQEVQSIIDNSLVNKETKLSLINSNYSIRHYLKRTL